MFYGKNKAVTFSYDDGILQDARLADIFNRYRLKATFNINTGLLDPKFNWKYKSASCVHMTAEEIKEALAGHEKAVHGVKHLDLTTLTKEQKEKEITEDIQNIKNIFGVAPSGMAYAYGAFDNESVEIERKAGLIYARTVRDTHSFDLQKDNLLTFNPTCHHNDKDLFALAEKFLSLPEEEPALFYVWGHAYEFDGDDNWQRIEEFCKLISGKKHIFYGTNREIFEKVFQNT